MPCSTKLSPRAIVRSGLCVGCGACTAGDPQRAMRWNRDGFLEPVGPGLDRATPEFARLCPSSPLAANEDILAAERFPAAPAADPAIGRFEAAWVGHVAEAEFRADGSSGGVVSWVASELLRSGAVDAVAHVEAGDDPRSGYFRYRLSSGEQQVRGGAKSRYYPVTLAQVLREIRTTPGRYAIVGVPCFIKAAHLLRRSEPLFAERIAVTLGLFCGHMKSAHMVASFAWQLGVTPAEVVALDYRRKDAGRPANWYRAQLALGDGRTVEQDWWHLADGDWGAGFFQNSACDFCDDVVAETADIAFGDAWVEPYASDGRGTNVVIARSRAMRAMIEQAIAAGRLELAPVDAGFIRRTQAGGLRHRREGLAYRLSRRRRGIMPRKRVAPRRRGIALRRRLVYRHRAAIARWSHRMFRWAEALARPGLYIGWAGLSLHLYAALAWSRGWLGAAVDRLLPPVPHDDDAEPLRG